MSRRSDYPRRGRRGGQQPRRGGRGNAPYTPYQGSNNLNDFPMGEVKRGGEDGEMTNTFNAFGTPTNPDPWNPIHPMSSGSSLCPRTEAPQDVQWTSSVFQNTFWDRRQCSPRPQLPTRSTTLIEHVQDLDIVVTANYDDELSMEAHSILEDILFLYQ